MKALRKTGKGKGLIEICEMPEPRISEPDDVIIRVAAAGVCGTDIHIMNDEFTYYPPVTLGHEFSGYVKAIGYEVTRFLPGELVVAEPHAQACMKCDLCRRGFWQICGQKRSPGWGRDGAFAEFVRMPEKLLHKVENRVDPLVAALSEPLAVVVSCLAERTRVLPEDTISIIGAGPIGILSALVAKTCGAKYVVVLGMDSDEPLRFRVALELGADLTINVMKEKAIEVMTELTRGRMSDVVVEASGAEKGIRSAFELVSKCGRICAAGLTGKENILVPWDIGQAKMLDVFFNMSSSYTSWDRAVSIVEHTPYNLRKLISHVGSIENWYSFFKNIQEGHALKAMFVPKGHAR